MSKFGVPTEEQLAKINKLAKRQLSADEVFVFPSKLAGDMIIPGRNVKLTKDLLDVFSADAKKGVSLMLDHSWSPDGFFGLGGRPKMAMPYGRTFDSKYETGTEDGETVSLVADHYMMKGVEIDGIKTDDLAASIEAGTLFDTSIGFSYSKGTCSVCGNDYRDYEKCKHIAGRTYEVEGEDGVTRNQFCYINAKPPGFLMENSLVFDGAYPSAGVLSKVGDVLENQNGTFQVIEELKDIDPEKPLIATYSNRTGLLTMVKKSDHKKVINLGGIDEGSKKGAKKLMNEKLLAMFTSFGMSVEDTEKLTIEDANEILNQLAEKWDKTVENIQAAAEPLKPIEGTFSATEYLGIPVSDISAKLGADTTADNILNLAKEGQDYHKQVVDEAVAMGVRAQGNDFPAETWKATFATMGTKAIKDIMKTFETQANSIPAGRHTDPEAGQKQSVSIPDDAFKVGK